MKALKRKTKTLSAHRRKSSSLRWQYRNKQPQLREKKKVKKIKSKYSKEILLNENVTLEEIKRVFKVDTAREAIQKYIIHKELRGAS